MRSATAAAVLTLGLAVGFAACGSVVRVFLDLPERQPPQPMALDSATAERLVGARPPELPPPAIESIHDVDSVLALLPRDHAGAIDWVAADRNGTIRPRATRRDAPPDSTSGFGYDFYIWDGDGPEAFFPHSTHSRWLACETCHGSIYRYRDRTRPSANPHGSESCGRCHGSIAFRIQDCERCHQQADLPPARQGPVRSSTIHFQRPDSAALAQRSAVSPGAKLYPPAFFPHFEHRLRYRCKACHEEPFALDGRSAVLTQEEAHGSGTCGSCHNGRDAFAAGLGSCERCHASSPSAVAARDSIARRVDTPVAPEDRRGGGGVR